MENNEKRISIVLPVYNVADYIDECIESILGQSYRNFELIIVDDGSEDAGGQICDNYAQEDSRITVIHKQNGGLSDARNAGIERSTGEYITFIDSDDSVSKYYLEILYRALIKGNAELSQGAFTRCKDELVTRTSYDRDDILQKTEYFERTAAFKDFLHRKSLYVSSCAKLYDRRLFETVRFPVGYLNEDNFTTYKLIYLANRCAVIYEPLYWHRINKRSIMQSAFSEKKLRVQTAPDEIEQFLGADAEQYQRDINYYRFRQNLSLYNRMVGQTRKKDFQKAKSELRKKIYNFKMKDIDRNKFRIALAAFRYAHPIYVKAIRRMYSKGKIS